jgi:hypothetical protein
VTLRVTLAEASRQKGVMTTPRVTEIPIAMATIEPDSFIDDASRPSVVGRRLAERAARERRTELVRRLIRARAARSRRP